MSRNDVLVACSTMPKNNGPAPGNVTTIALLHAGVFTAATVPLLRRLGVWGVTRQRDCECGSGYRVTHLPTGLSVSEPLRQADALALLKGLQERCPGWQASAPFTGPLPTVDVEALRAVVSEIHVRRTTKPREPKMPKKRSGKRGKSKSG
jgi:hypothetical protein